MRKFLKGFIYAWQGINYAFSTQINFRFHSAAAILVIVAGWYFEISRQEWLCLLAAIALVIATELFNTALEVLVNLVSPEYNRKAGIIKDLASAAVLVIAILAIIIGLFIFIPKLV